MPTIKDIARAVGVSHATVSNVLNHKGNVSAEKIKLVMDAAAAMGYRVNEAASTLRSGSAQIMAVILPDTGSAAYDDLYRSLCQTAAEHGYSMLLRLTDNVLGTEFKAIQDVLSSRARCAVVVTSLPDAAKRYEVLVRAGIEVVFAVRGKQHGYLYAGFDLVRAAREMARRVIADGASSVALMTSMTCYPSQAAFKQAFIDAADGCQVRCIESISSQYSKQAFSLFDADGPDAIVTTSEEMAHAVWKVGGILGRKPRIYPLAPKRILHSDQYTVYGLNYRRLGADLGRMLLSEQERHHIVGESIGFAPLPPHFSSPRSSTLSLLTADTPVIRALERLLPRLKQDTGIDLSMTVLPSQEVSRAFSQPDVIRQYDIARMDLSLMDLWAAELFTPMQELNFPLKEVLPRFLPGLAQEYSLVDHRYMALPLDPGCHLLFYREDLMRDPVLQRKYFERYRASLTVPATRTDFLRTADFFNSTDIAACGVPHPLILTRRPSECVSDLASLSPSGQWPYLNASDLAGYIDRRRTLESCAVFVEGGSWSSAVSRFARGESALLIAHSNYTRHLADEPLSTVSGRVGFTPAPGGKVFLGGGLIGVLSTSDAKDAAAVFLSWLFSPEISRLTALLSGCSPFANAYESEELSDIYPWLSTVRDGLTNGIRRRLFQHLPSRCNHMELEKNIALLCDQAVQGQLSPQETASAVNELVFHV